MQKILFVDDTIDNLERFKQVLGTHFDFTLASNAETALEYAKSDQFDLFLIDILMPVKNGLQLHDEIVSADWYAGTPIVLKSMSRNEEMKLEALSLTKTDFIGFGMSFDEIRVRLSNQIFRHKREKKIILGHSFVLDVDNVRAEYNGDCLGLTKHEFIILKTLSSKKLVPKYDLIDLIWGNKNIQDDNNINTHIANLRKKIEVTPFKVVNIRGKGYYLDSIVKC
ncbi:response regulator transcription factor [Halobacteriovorax sp. HLS]|uniref:response regulator transcription factor n=1 Tax=Halobacteriovorax sp. HLS TaxID=2234000 RepID=UPI000FD9268B|nr:response regulator transcription factor [Halobacteriovorax sp. HLS]